MRRQKYNQSAARGRNLVQNVKKSRREKGKERGKIRGAEDIVETLGRCCNWGHLLWFPGREADIGTHPVKQAGKKLNWGGGKKQNKLFRHGGERTRDSAIPGRKGSKTKIDGVH